MLHPMITVFTPVALMRIPVTERKNEIQPPEIRTPIDIINSIFCIKFL